MTEINYKVVLLAFAIIFVGYFLIWLFFKLSDIIYPLKGGMKKRVKYLNKY